MNKIERYLSIWFVSFLIYLGAVLILWVVMSPNFTPDLHDLDIPYIIADITITIVWVISYFFIVIYSNKYCHYKLGGKK